jgi:hypothetical protein
MSTYKILGGHKVVWGTSEVGPTAAGTIFDASESTEGSEEVIETEDGAVDGVTAYDETTTFNLTILAAADAVPPALYEKITIKIAEEEELVGYVSATGRTWGNKAHKRITLTATFRKHLEMS